MRFRNLLLSGMLAAGCITASAQEKEKVAYDFNPHWYIQAQFGAQYTLGEVDFVDLISPNAQLGVGYNFSPAFGLRLAVNAWQSKAGWELSGNTYKWDWNYVAPALTGHLSLTNLIGGFNPKRVVNVGLFAGIGANIGFNNDAAATASKTMLAMAPNGFREGEDALSYLWADTKARLLGQFGADIDFRLTDKLSLGIELQANTLSDHYNSKKAKNADWYFNGLVGVKYAFGKTYTKRAVKPCCCPEPVVTERVVEKVVEVPVEKEVAKKEALRRDVFFDIRSNSVSLTEKQKVAEVAEYMKKYPESKAVITGYADKSTGNASINSKYAEARAKAVVDTLVNEYGISASRITYDSKGDTEQPFNEQVLNRAAIVVAE